MEHSKLILMLEDEVERLSAFTKSLIPLNTKLFSSIGEQCEILFRALKRKGQSPI